MLEFPIAAEGRPRNLQIVEDAITAALMLDYHDIPTYLINKSIFWHTQSQMTKDNSNLICIPNEYQSPTLSFFIHL